MCVAVYRKMQQQLHCGGKAALNGRPEMVSMTVLSGDPENDRFQPLAQDNGRARRLNIAQKRLSRQRTDHGAAHWAICNRRKTAFFLGAAGVLRAHCAPGATSPQKEFETMRRKRPQALILGPDHFHRTRELAIARNCFRRCARKALMQ
jgi:hypothetical protein